MASKKKTYFLVPGWDIPPLAMQLGNIIADPTEPHKALNRTPPHRLLHTQTDGSMSKSLLTSSSKSLDTSTESHTSNGTEAPPTIIDTEIHTTTLTNFTAKLSTSKSNKFGIFTQFLQIFGLGGETSVEYRSDDLGSCAFASLSTEWFIPSQSFIENSMSEPAIQDFLKMVPRKTPLYIITGLRVGTGLRCTTSNWKGKVFGGMLGLDGAAVGVPLSVGPLVEHGRKKGEEVQWEADGPLVFAYQLCRVRFVKESWDKKDFVKGAMYGIGEKDKFMIVHDEEGDDFLEDLDDVDANEGWDEVNEEGCVVVTPKA